MSRLKVWSICAAVGAFWLVGCEANLPTSSDGSQNSFEKSVEKVVTTTVKGPKGPKAGQCDPGDVLVCHQRHNGGFNPICADTLEDHVPGHEGDFVADADGDGFTVVGACAGSADDCDDTDPAINPAAEEICDGLDNDCDGVTDEDDVCSPGQDCSTSGACKIIFVTSTGYTGDLMTAGAGASGLEGADNICNMHATNAGLPGTYTAWVSADGPGGAINAKDRVTQATVPYHVPAGSGGGVGAKVADDFTDIITCEGTFPAECLDSAIDRDENGNSINRGVWTGTRENGNRFGFGSTTACQNWTDGTGDGSGCGQSSSGVGRGREGRSNRTTSSWTNLAFCGCGNDQSLYCFQD